MSDGDKVLWKKVKKVVEMEAIQERACVFRVGKDGFLRGDIWAEIWKECGRQQWGHWEMNPPEEGGGMTGEQWGDVREGVGLRL